jgi:hypothetical protein
MIEDRATKLMSQDVHVQLNRQRNGWLATTWTTGSKPTLGEGLGKTQDEALDSAEKNREATNV